MNVPFIRLDRQFEKLHNEVITLSESVFLHGKVLQGPEVSALEKRLAELFKTEYASTVGSGTDALIFALKALELIKGARIAVPALSFIASASCVVHAGCTPVFIDIDDNYFANHIMLLDLIKKRAIDAVIAVHLYGQMMDLEEIYHAARKQGIYVIEDAAQCIGAKRNGYHAGKFSDITCISFDPTKVIGAYGSGGAIVTNNSRLNKRIQKLRYHGQNGNRIYDEVGYNSQMATIQAALVNLKLNYLDEWKSSRINIANIYSEKLKSITYLKTPSVLPGNEHVFHKYVIRIKNYRNKLMNYLKENGIMTSIHYELPLHKQPCFKQYTKGIKLPNAEDIVTELLSLPIYPELLPEEIKYVYEKIQEFGETL